MNKSTFENKQLRDTSYHDLKEHKNNRRIWLEGNSLNRVSFEHNTLFRVECDIDNLRVILRAVPTTPENIELHKKRKLNKVAGRKMTGWVKPIIDICNANITEVFEKAYGVHGRFAAYAYDGVIVFTTHPDDAKRIHREVSLARNLDKGLITEGSAFTGIGISTHALHSGYKAAGLKPKLKWAVEYEGRYLDCASKNSPEIYGDARLFTGKVEEVETTLLEPVNSFSFSMSCTDYSAHGKTKKKLDVAEDGETITQLFGVLNIIRAANPAILISENVPLAKDSVSYKMLIKELTRLGYVVKEMILDQKHSGALDRRQRYWFVAVSAGLNIDIDSLIPDEIDMVYSKVGEILDSETQTPWFPQENLLKRERINKENGRNFSMTLVDNDTTVVSTIPRNYTKHQVSNPHLTDGNGNYRLFSRTEHARLKAIPEHLVDHLSETVAHEGLGQSVVYNQARGCSTKLGYAILNSTQKQVSLML